MNNTHNIFGKSVDIQSYKEKISDHQKYKGYKFVGYGWLDLEKKYNMETDSDELSNVGVRASLHSERDIDSFAHRLKKQGLDQTKHPLPYDVSKDKCMGGRKRIKSFIKLKERFIPIAKYEPISETLEVRGLITAGLKENMYHENSDETEFADYISAAKVLIKAKELDQDKDSVESWLKNDVQIENYFTKYTIDKLVESICNLDEEGLELMRCIDRQDAIDYCRKHLKKEKSTLDVDKDIELMSPNEVNMYRILGKLIERAKLNLPTNVIFYSTSVDPDKATKKMSEFSSMLEKDLIGGLSHLINSDLPKDWPSQLTFGVPFKTKKLKILGCIPQKKNNKHHENKYNSHDLISCEEY